MGGLGAGAPLTQPSSSQQGARLGSGPDTPTEKGLALEEDGEGWDRKWYAWVLEAHQERKTIFNRSIFPCCQLPTPPLPSPILR